VYLLFQFLLLYWYSNKFVDDGLDLSQYLDVNILTGAVKLFFRELPIPLITFDAYKDIMKATIIVSNLDCVSQTHWQSLISALKLLPKAHYATLHHLAQHLHRYNIGGSLAKFISTVTCFIVSYFLDVVFFPALQHSKHIHSSYFIFCLHGSNKLSNKLICASKKLFVDYLISKDSAELLVFG
jgi:hypothetical protein